MSTTTTPLRRPALVTVAVVLVYVSALVSVGFGILVLLSRYRVPADEVLSTSLLGAGIILFGLLTLGIASALARGSRLARLLTTIYLVIAFALHVATTLATEWDPISLVLLVIDAFIVAALWLPAGARHFRR